MFLNFFCNSILKWPLLLTKMLFISCFVQFSFRTDQVYDSHFTGWSTVHVFAQLLPVTNFMAERPLKNSPCSHQTFISLDIQFLCAWKFLSLYKNGYACFLHQSEFGVITNKHEITEFLRIFYSQCSMAILMKKYTRICSFQQTLVCLTYDKFYINQKAVSKQKTRMKMHVYFVQ
jgi:hypothetical protein